MTITIEISDGEGGYVHWKSTINGVDAHEYARQNPQQEITPALREGLRVLGRFMDFQDATRRREIEEESA